MFSMKVLNLLAGPVLYGLLGANAAAAILDSYAILDKAAIETAAPAELSAEVSVFESIGIGITLSIAQCESVDFCRLTPQESEIEELINLLVYRIDTLTARQQTGDSEGLDGILSTYVNQRDNYTGYLVRLRRVNAAQAAATSPVEAPGRAESIEAELNFFADEELVDDEALVAPSESSGS